MKRFLNLLSRKTAVLLLAALTIVCQLALKGDFKLAAGTKVVFDETKMGGTLVIPSGDMNPGNGSRTITVMIQPNIDYLVANYDDGFEDVIVEVVLPKGTLISASYPLATVITPPKSLVASTIEIVGTMPAGDNTVLTLKITNIQEWINLDVTYYSFNFNASNFFPNWTTRKNATDTISMRIGSRTITTNTIKSNGGLISWNSSRSLTEFKQGELSTSYIWGVAPAPSPITVNVGSSGTDEAGNGEFIYTVIPPASSSNQRDAASVTITQTLTIPNGISDLAITGYPLAGVNANVDTTSEPGKIIITWANVPVNDHTTPLETKFAIASFKYDPMNTALFSGPGYNDLVNVNFYVEGKAVFVDTYPDPELNPAVLSDH